MSRVSPPCGKEKAMCVVHMRIRCSDKYSELLVGDVEYAELTIESIVGTALLEVFNIVQFENVTVQQLPGPDDGDGKQGSARWENAMI
jgi:hypothetical protein